jgi:predicted hydrocarbon binding protein/KaiC/GvpD/RAD55 family RecA-like ATPase
MSKSVLQSPPERNLILITGLPGAGKSTFCQQIALKTIAEGRPVIFVTTERTASELTAQLRRGGLGGSMPEFLAFVDAYTETVGLVCSQDEKTTCANCADFNSMSIAVTKLQRQLPGDGITLIFDSMTSPYLFNGLEVVKFMQLFLAKFTQQGNSVVVTIDDGCGKEADLGAVKSVADGLVSIELGRNKQIFRVTRYPGLSPGEFESPIQKDFSVDSALGEILDPEYLKDFMDSLFFNKTRFRPRLGDYVNPFWTKLVYWSGMLWDPKGFPKLIYDNTKEDQSATGSEVHRSILPTRFKLLFSLLDISRKAGFFPQNFSAVENMKRVNRMGFPYGTGARKELSGIIKYLPDQSGKDEHYFRIYENSDCWDFEGVGSATASHLPPSMAGQLIGLETIERDWNAVETRCIGLGDPYCEFRLSPQLESGKALHAGYEPENVSRIHQRLIENLAAGMLEGKKLSDRPRLGNRVHLHVAFHACGFPHIGGDRSKMAVRMGGALTGKKIAEYLQSSGQSPEQLERKLFQFIKNMKAGIVSSSGGIIRIEENIEPLRTKYMTAAREPSCYFTTGFLNGIYRQISGMRVRETRCIAGGNPFCEWELI